jgi:hypothetical protein
MTNLVSGILVGILTSIGWQKLIVSVGIDCLRYWSKNADNELVKNILDDLADAIEHPDKPATPGVTSGPT